MGEWMKEVEREREERSYTELKINVYAALPKTFQCTSTASKRVLLLLNWTEWVCFFGKGEIVEE